MSTSIYRQTSEIAHQLPWRKRPVFFALALVLVLLTSCGGAAGSPTRDGASLESEQESTSTPSQEGENASIPSSNANPDPLTAFNSCELLTPTEVEGFFGEPMAPDPAPESIGPYRSCMFSSQAGGKLIIVQVTHENAAQFKADNEGSAAMLEMIPTPVSGLGDETVFFSGLLRVRVGETVLQVVTWHTEAEQDQAFAMSQEIARLALPRLP